MPREISAKYLQTERQKLNSGAFRVAGYTAGIVLNSIY